MTEPLQSCFLPGTQVQYAWDSTSLGYFKTCPRLYYYTMICGYQSPDESIHLRFGTEVHTAIEGYEKLRAKGESFDDAVAGTIHSLILRVREWNPDRDSKAGKYKNPDTLVGAVLDYLDYYRNDSAVTAIRPDGAPAVELSFSFELDFGPTAHQPYTLCGHLDRVVNFNGDLFVLDHKTSTQTLGGYFFNQFDPSNQMTLYTIGGQVILSSPIRGVIVDGIQLLLTEPTRFVRGFTYRTQEQLEEWKDNLRTHLTVARAYAEAEDWPMNDTACGNYGGCRFREVCSASPNVREVYLRKFKRPPVEERWDPLRAR